MAFDQRTYVDQYDRDHYDRIALRLPKGGKEALAEAAAKRGMSINQYIASLIDEDMKKEG